MAELIELYHKNQEILMLKLGFGAISIAWVWCYIYKIIDD
jgi:hypothetical protein